MESCINKEYQFVKVEKINDNVVKVIMNRPRRGNALNSEMGLELVEIFEELENDSLIRAVIFTGNGRYFCTGMDLGSANQSSLGKQLDNNKKKGGSMSFTSVFEKIKNFKKPLIGVINGPVYGGGCGLVFCCDFRIMHKSAFLCFSEVTRGIVPALISAIIVPQLGEFQSKQYMMTGIKLYATKLNQLGLITSMGESPEELDEETNKLINQLLLCAPNAVSVTKKACEYVSTHTSQENSAFVTNIFKQTVHSEEALYGIGKFIKKEKPDWNAFIRSKL
eukprot:TRINITY_DN2592_c0_g1_i1.p1 TRINITY_DN2592_c0_g1~~TRINITY_DN2592_c0_g1_i1.p1  ORF type:complete len:278 (-),score=82.55 TRINITY_DN2592_c0_g1_i1:36-869(-)